VENEGTNTNHSCERRRHSVDDKVIATQARAVRVAPAALPCVLAPLGIRLDVNPRTLVPRLHSFSGFYPSLSKSATQRHNDHWKASPTFQLGLLWGSFSYYALIRSLPHNLRSGIPFAEPPVSSLRFAPPQPKLSLAPLRSFKARNYGLQCLQPVSPSYYSPLREPNNVLQYSNADMSENCLTLNVFRPSGVNMNSRLPVMVWIYGGGFISERWMSHDRVL
jgi:Carboxylesterase family